tara:strand:+ start:1034 stop:1612 length:579 start_codon:yes stop_codon:yes gene_type:complete
MPWKYNGATLRVGKEFTGTDGTQYPKVWMRYSADEKAAIGITFEDPPASEAAFDNRFYWGRNDDGSLIPRSLTDTLWVDEDGEAVTDSLTGEQGVTLGLKAVAIVLVKTQAAGLLAVHDWQVIKATEVDSYSVPSAVTTYRAAVRTASNAIGTAIANASDLDAFIALYDTPVDSDGEPTGDPAPINAWPDAI